MSAEPKVKGVGCCSHAIGISDLVTFNLRLHVSTPNSLRQFLKHESDHVLEQKAHPMLLISVPPSPLKQMGYVSICGGPSNYGCPISVTSGKRPAREVAHHSDGELSSARQVDTLCATLNVQDVLLNQFLRRKQERAMADEKYDSQSLMWGCVFGDANQARRYCAYTPVRT